MPRCCTARGRAVSSLLAAFAAIVLLAGCRADPPPPQTPAQVQFSRYLWSRVMEGSPSYGELGGDKSLFVCVRWPQPGLNDFWIGGFSSAIAAAGNDKAIPRERLRAYTEGSCQREHEAEKDCTCQEFDRNGRNVFTVPEGVVLSDDI